MIDYLNQRKSPQKVIIYIDANTTFVPKLYFFKVERVETNRNLFPHLFGSGIIIFPVQAEASGFIHPAFGFVKKSVSEDLYAVKT